MQCWNCSSDDYVETVSKEHCPSCGIFCDYHGAGTNEEYEIAHERKHARMAEEMSQILDRLGY